MTLTWKAASSTYQEANAGNVRFTADQYSGSWTLHISIDGYYQGGGSYKGRTALKELKADAQRWLDTKRADQAKKEAK
jgi:hypothetical protein